MTTSAAYQYMFLLILSISPGIVLAWWRARQSGTTFSDYIGLRPNINSVALLFVYGLACYIVAILGRTAINAMLSSSDPTAVYIQPDTTQIMKSMVQLLPVSTIIFAVVVGVLEEIIFRGWLISEVQRFCARNKQFGLLGNPVIASLMAVVATSILFAIGHGSLVFFPAFLLVGMVFGSARILTNSLVPPMVAHGLMNFIAALPVHSGT